MSQRKAASYFFFQRLSLHVSLRNFPHTSPLRECLISTCASRHSYSCTYVINVSQTATDVGFNYTYMYKHEPSILHDEMPCTTHLTTLTFQIKQAITLQADIAPRVLHNAFIENVCGTLSKLVYSRTHVQVCRHNS